MSYGNDEINKKPENNEQDWSKVEKTHDFVDYVYAKYGNSWKESDEISDEMLADLYNYAMLKGLCVSCIVLYMVKVLMVVPNTLNGLKMVSKHPLWSANGLQNTPNGLHIICSVRKYLSMVESSKATNKDYTKGGGTIEMIVEYVSLNMGTNDKGNGKVHDLENIIEKLDVDKEAKQAEHDQLKVNNDDKGKGKVQVEHDHLKVNKDMHFVVLSQAFHLLSQVG
ncbi:hypothetical protein Tco_0299099 [Tanacetum coccineum]